MSSAVNKSENWILVQRLLICLLFFCLPNDSRADEVAEAISQIQRLGGTVRKSNDGFEIALHLKGRNSVGKALPYVARLEDTVWLNLANSNVTDIGLTNLSKLKKLRSLHLENTKIGDQGIEHLDGLENLEYLNLFATSVSDASVKNLRRLRKLKRLYVWQSRMTKSGVAELEKSIPGLKVVFGVDLSELPDSIPTEAKEPIPKLKLAWVSVGNRTEAPTRSDNGVNCQVWFENKSTKTVKLYWISYGQGDLKYYATLKPEQVRKQNSYSRNAWLITDLEENPLGYFIAKDDDALAIIPK